MMRQHCELCSTYAPCTDGLCQDCWEEAEGVCESCGYIGECDDDGYCEFCSDDD